MYEKQGFYSGQKLQASQLDVMEDGIIEAQALASQGAAGTANMEKGTGDNATQQCPRADKVTQVEGEETLHFSFTGHPDAAMQGRIQYGAVGNYSAAMNGRSAALNKHAFAINNSTVAKGEESFAQGYETIAEGNSSFAGGSRSWARGEAAVALGSSTKALGVSAFAMGARTNAQAEVSSAFGVDNVADGYASSVFGHHNSANELGQMVVGQYNDPVQIKENFHSVFKVGCGSSEETRMNAFDVSEGGEIVIRWNNGYYSLQNVMNILNNYLNLINNTEGLDHFVDAKINKITWASLERRLAQSLKIWK